MTKARILVGRRRRRVAFVPAKFNGVGRLIGSLPGNRLVKRKSGWFLAISRTFAKNWWKE